MDYEITLPGGTVLQGLTPVVVIGPNGSGKTRQTRTLTASVPIDFINALRNTRVAPELPAVGVDTARQQFTNQKNQSRSHHWELASEFDYMLSQLLAQQSMAAMAFTRRYKVDPSTAGTPEETPLSKVEGLWSEVFPGRDLHWSDWKPLIKNTTTGTEYEYSGNQMSDGEKAALYLAGRVFSSEAGILVVDEPETHFHSLLAVRFWTMLERARPDIRFVYVTHDLAFALSRHSATFVIASPTEGLKPVNLGEGIPIDIADALLGSASLSFYASRVVFCEGDETSIDARLYGSWFNGPDTVVRSVASCHRVMRCVEAMNTSGLATALTAIGIVDSDFHPDAFRRALPAGLTMLDVHEVESLMCLPEVVAAVCAHLSRPFDVATYESSLRATVNDGQRNQLMVERWKRRIEPNLEGLVARVQARGATFADLVSDLPMIFDHTQWTFSPEQILAEERDRVEQATRDGSIADLLAIVPGKQLLPIAARQASLDVGTYTSLVVDSLVVQGEALTVLGAQVEAALEAHLPDRRVPIKDLPHVP